VLVVGGGREGEEETKGERGDTLTIFYISQFNIFTFINKLN